MLYSRPLESVKGKDALFFVIVKLDYSEDSVM